METQQPWDQKREEERQRSYVKGLDAGVDRRKREESALSLRKQKRESSLQKKRREAAPTPAEATAPASATQDTQTRMRLASLPALVERLGSPDPMTQYEACRMIRRMLSVEKNPPISDVMAFNVIPIFVEFLRRKENPKLQFEAAWALTNIASGSSEQTRAVVNGGCVQLFVELMQSPDVDVREQAVWALGNIAGDSIEYRDLVLNEGAMSRLLTQFTASATDAMIRNATWTLSNFCRGKPPFKVVQDALPYLARLIYSEDTDVLSDACWALSYLTESAGDQQEQHIQAVVESRVCKRLVRLMMHPDPKVVAPALRAIGNIVTGDDLQTQVVLNCGALPCLVSLLGPPHSHAIRKEACWTISNITAGNLKQIQDVIDAQVMPTMVQLLQTAETDIRKEACWAVSNATCGTVAQVKHLVEQCHCIKPLCDMLFVEDPKIVLVALEALDKILKVGARDAATHHTQNRYQEEVEEADGVAKIDALQRHANRDIYKRAAEIIETYFSDEGGEADAAAVTAPATQGNQFAFTVEGAPPAAVNFMAPSPGASAAPSDPSAAPAPPAQQMFTFQ